jgi:hypothetical protein
MLRTFLSLILIGLLMLGVNAAPVAAQNNTDAQTVEKVRLKVTKVGLGDKARVTVRMKDGRKIKGFVTQATASDFTVRDRKTADPTLIPYSDVSKVEDNRGHSTLRNVLIGVGVGAGAFLALIIIAIANYDD